MARVRWYDAPLDTATLRKLAEAISRNEYTARRSWGFRLAERRRDRLQASYVERVERVETATDPFGAVSEYPVVEFRTVTFSLSTAFPGLELRDPPRGLGDLFKRLAEYADFNLAIEEVRISLADWVREVQVRTSGTLFGAEYSSISLSAEANAFVRVEGTNDIRTICLQLLGKRSHRMSRALLRWQNRSEQTTVDIKEPARVSVSGSRTQEAVSLLRESLAAAREQLASDQKA